MTLGQETRWAYSAAPSTTHSVQRCSIIDLLLNLIRIKIYSVIMPFSLW